MVENAHPAERQGYKDFLDEVMPEREFTTDDVDVVYFFNASGRVVEDDFADHMKQLEEKGIKCVAINSEANDPEKNNLWYQGARMVNLIKNLPLGTKIGLMGRSLGGYVIAHILANPSLTEEDREKIMFAVTASTPFGDPKNASKAFKGLVAAQLAVPETVLRKTIGVAASIAERLPGNPDPHKRVRMLSKDPHDLGHVYHATLHTEWGQVLNKIPPEAPFVMFVNQDDSFLQASGVDLNNTASAHLTVIRPEGKHGNITPEEMMRAAAYCIDRHPNL